jgi:AcrR family transcriptional regulator
MSESIPLRVTNHAIGHGERSDAVANRQRILEATRQLFAEQGPEAISMTDIVQAAGVGRGTLYRHFPNKAELCLAVMDGQTAEFQNDVLDRLRQMTAANAPAMEKLDYFLDRLVYFTEAYTPLLREVQRQDIQHFEKKGGAPQNWQQATVSGLLRMAVASGEILADQDIDYLTDAILAPLNAHLFHFQRVEKGYLPERISAGLRDFVARLRLLS